jgi:hypothetical protein
MYERIGFVQSRQGGLVAMHEPLLDLSLLDWEKEAQHAMVFRLEDRDTVLLGHFPDPGFRKERL